MRTLSFSSLGVSAAAAALLLVIPFLGAGPGATGADEPFDPPPVDERELDAFAEAYVVVAAVHQRIAVDGEAYTDPERLLAFKEEGEAEATRAIESAGLTRERFQAILSRLANDGDLRDTAIAKIARARSAAASAFGTEPAARNSGA